jgi:hypothetical protein
MKNTTHTQDLREAFTSIISMMLGLLRAQGWRGLRHLPEIVMVVFLLRSIARRFAALMDAHAAGTLSVAVAPAMAAQPAPACRAETPRVGSRPAGPRQRRPRSQPAPAKPARVRAFARAWPCPKHTPYALSYDVLATGRST